MVTAPEEGLGPSAEPDDIVEQTEQTANPIGPQRFGDPCRQPGAVAQVVDELRPDPFVVGRAPDRHRYLPTR